MTVPSRGERPRRRAPAAATGARGRTHDVFTDYVRVGTSLQPVFVVVTTLGIAVIWGV